MYQSARARLPIEVLFERIFCAGALNHKKLKGRYSSDENLLENDECSQFSEFPDVINQTIFSAPFHVPESWQPPVVEKSEEERRCLLDVMNANFMFSNNMCTDEDKARVVDAMKKVECLPGEKLYDIGDECDYIYVIQMGTVSFRDSKGHIVFSKTKNMCFGEVGLMYDSPRTTSCSTDTECVFWRLDHITFRSILAADQIEEDNKWKKFLRKVPYFIDLDDHSMATICNSLRKETYKKGSRVVSKGDVPDKFFVIQSGSVSLHEDKPADAKQTLSSGSYFGDLAIISKDKKEVNITTLEDTTFLTLPADTFRTVLGDLDNLILSSQDRRMLASIPIFIEADIRPHEVDCLASFIKDVQLKAGCTLFTAEDNNEDGLYLVRTGEVIVNMPGKYQRIKAGGYFGESTLLTPDPIEGEETSSLTKDSILAATITVDATLGVLRKEKVLSVLRGRIGKNGAKVDPISESFDMITVSDLKRLRLLGSGTFGKVYLAQTKSRKNKKVFALKVQSKHHLIKHKMQHNIMRERNLMNLVSTPFVSNLVSATQDENNLYMVLPFYQGGELLSIMDTSKKLRRYMSESTASFYGAVTLLGLDHLHQHNIVYRDFKPENVLIDINGYPVIIDLGFSKIVTDKTFTFCGTPVYLAPEIIVNKGYNQAADRWAWAVVLYEMILGVTPFYKDKMDAMELFKRIIRANVSFPVGSVTHDFKNLMRSIFQPQPSRRLGNSTKGNEDIMEHRWFRTTNFSGLRSKSMDAPWLPPCRSLIDTGCFKPVTDDLNEEKDTESKLTPAEQNIFENYGPYIK